MVSSETMPDGEMEMSFAKSLTSLVAGAALCASASAIATTSALAQDKKPNIVFIMGDDIGWMQPSIYHEGLMVGETPNIDRIGHEGAKFMDYYAMQSCTSGRNAFVTACIRCAPA
jgi:arylsulfatase